MGFAAWATFVVGAAVSFVVAVLLQPQHVEYWFDLIVPLTKREWTDLVVAISLFSHIIITGGFICLTTVFYKGLEEDRERAVDRLFTNIHTPILKAEGEHPHLDNRQRILLGRMISIAGILIMAMTAIPNSLRGRLVFLACEGVFSLSVYCCFLQRQMFPKGMTTTRMTLMTPRTSGSDQKKGSKKKGVRLTFANCKS